MAAVLPYKCNVKAYIWDVVCKLYLKMFCTFDSVVAITFHSAHVSIHVSSHIHTYIICNEYSRMIGRYVGRGRCEHK
jgi:hypothetical protein